MDREQGRTDRKETVNANDALDIEQLALKTGITGEQAQDLVDRLGNDRELLEQAALSLKNAG